MALTKVIGSGVGELTDKVGLGLSSPAAPLHVQTSTDGTGLSGDDVYVARFHNQEATSDKSFGVDIQAGSSTTDQALRIKDHDGTNSLMVVDGVGNVTKPLNPSFRALGNNGAYQTTTPVPFPNLTSNNAGFNIGSHYNTSNYRFTAPVAGKYLFHVHMGIVNIGANGGHGYPYLRINGTPIAYSFVQMPASASYMPAHLTQIFSLAANDYVDVTFNGSNGTYYGNFTELSFQGCLLG